MAPLYLITKAGLYVLMGVCVLAAFGAVSLPNIFHAALALAATLIGVAGLYLALGAEFLAVVQILLYVGAVVTLLIFAIMLTQSLGSQTGRSKNSLGLPALGVCLIFFTALVQVI